MDGVIKDLQELTGHKTTSMTCRYAQLATSLKLAAVARLVAIQADREHQVTSQVTPERFGFNWRSGGDALKPCMMW